MLLQLEPKIEDIFVLRYKNGERITCKAIKSKILCQNCILYNTITMCNSVVCRKEDRNDNTDIIIVKV